MKKSLNRLSPSRLLPLLLLPLATLAGAQQAAHDHGRMALDLAVDAQRLVLTMEAPLDSFLRFERAPRTDAERKQVAAMVERLKAADKLFIPDAKAECKFSGTTLESAVLGLGSDDKSAAAHPAGDAHGEHADIDITVAFDCAKAPMARQIEVRMFDAFPRLRVIDAQVASEQGQFKRRLTKAAPTLRWGR